MTVQTILDSNFFKVLAVGNTDKIVEKVFCCDLLSIAMSKAPEHGAWVTVMGNKNTLAVASLVDISCLILAEGAMFSESDLAHAVDEGLTVLATDMPVFDAGLNIQELMI